MDIFGNFSNLKGDKNLRHVKRSAELDFSYSDAAVETIADVDQEKKPVNSSFVLKSVLILLFGILIGRLFILEVVNGEFNQKLAEGNRIRPRIIEAGRGIISDKDGVWLARNEPNFALAVYPSDLPKAKADREIVYQKLSELSGMPKETIVSLSEENGLLSLDMVTLKDNLAHDDALVMEKKIAGLPGVVVAKKSSREYASIPGLSHILGYTGKISPQDATDNPDYFLSDKIGKTGLEAEYEKNLKGKHGIEQIEVNSKGNIVRVLIQDGNKEPVSGNNISLYLDRGLQEKTAEALKTGIEEAKKATGNDKLNAGVAAVMDVKTGGILSMVSLPDYDDNLFSTQISSEDYGKLVNDPTYPMFDRAIQGTYPPGSISKIILASAGLMEGNITKNTSFNTPPEIKIGDYTFPDWKDHSYESTNIERAIAESNNVFFYSLGGGYDKIKGLGIDNINKYWKLFGLGEKTGIDLPGESGGFLPTADWKKKQRGESWYLGDTYHVSIGQGDLLITPMQMLRATATIANGGTLLRPQLVKKITDSSGKVTKEFGPRVESQNFLRPDVVKTVQEGMRMAVTDGSARNMSDLPVSVAGKTGTAQFFNNEKTHAWFEAYAPYENPQIAILVMVEGGGGGHEIAAPVAHEILNYYFTR